MVVVNELKKGITQKRESITVQDTKGKGKKDSDSKGEGKSEK